jgi:probable LLM family oxidoreductase
MELGVYTFAEMTRDPVTGVTISAAERLEQLIAAVELADQVGLDVYGLGEHHRPDVATSAPAVVLAAAAARTASIRLTSAVTVLGTDDPVRVFEQFATLDLVSRGRAEIIVGRGIFLEPFQLFGVDREVYDDIFAEKLELLLRIRAEERVTWSGRYRTPLHGQGVYPRPVQPELPVWVGVGGALSSAVRAGRLGLPLALGIIGGETRQFLPLAQAYRQAGREAGHAPSKLRISINSHGFLADSGAAALDSFYPPYEILVNRMVDELGFAPPSRARFEAQCGPEGAVIIGDWQTVAEKILYHHNLFGHQRCLIQLGVGTMPQDQVLHAIELLGTKVAPFFREAITRRSE